MFVVHPLARRLAEHVSVAVSQFLNESDHPDEKHALKRSTLAVGVFGPKPAQESPESGEGTSIILVLSQYKRIGCSPDKRPDTRTTATASDGGSRDSVRDRYSCIAVERSERPQQYERRDR